MLKKRSYTDTKPLTNEFLIMLKANIIKGISLKKEYRFQYIKKEIKGFLVCHVPEEDALVMMLHLSNKVPIKKTIPVLELLNFLNQHHSDHHLLLHSKNRLVILTSMIFINKGVIDEEEFSNSIQKILDYGHFLFPVILKKITTNKSPKVLMKSFLKSIGCDAEACIHEGVKDALECEYNDPNFEHLTTPYFTTAK